MIRRQTELILRRFEARAIRNFSVALGPGRAVVTKTAAVFVVKRLVEHPARTKAGAKLPCSCRHAARAQRTRSGPFAREGRERAVALTLVTVLGFGAVLLPGMARNYVVGGSFTGSSALGKTLFCCATPLSTRSSPGSRASKSCPT